MASSTNQTQTDLAVSNLVVKETLTAQKRLTANQAFVNDLEANEIKASSLSTNVIGTTGDIIARGSITSLEGNVEAIGGNVTAGGNVVAGGNVQSTTGNILVDGPTSGLVFSGLQSVAETAMWAATLHARVGVATFSTGTIAAAAAQNVLITNSLVHAGTQAIIDISGNQAFSGLVKGTVTPTAGLLTVGIVNSGSLTFDASVSNLKLTILLLN